MNPASESHPARANDVVMAYFLWARAWVQPMVPPHSALAGDVAIDHRRSIG